MVISYQDIYPRSYFMPYDPVTNPYVRSGDETSLNIMPFILQAVYRWDWAYQKKKGIVYGPAQDLSDAFLFAQLIDFSDHVVTHHKRWASAHGLGVEVAADGAQFPASAAILNSQFEFPARRITINLAPADLPKDSGPIGAPRTSPWS